MTKSKKKEAEITKDLVQISKNARNESTAIFERKQQMFAICAAFRKELWDALNEGRLPLNVSWRLTKETEKDKLTGMSCQFCGEAIWKRSDETTYCSCRPGYGGMR